MTFMRKLVLLIGGVFFVFVLASCGGGDSTTTTPSDGQEPGSNPHPWGIYSGVSVDFVDRTFRVSGGGTDDPKDTDPIFLHLASATQSLDIAVPKIDRQEVVDVILSTADRVHVRVLTEKAFAEDPHYRPYLEQLRLHPNIEVRTDQDGEPRIMHARFLIIDGARVVTGSYNWSEEASERTIGDLLVINDSRIASTFTNQFNQMFVEGKFGTAKRDATPHSFPVFGNLGVIDVYFGPTNKFDQILQGEIEQSRHVASVVEQFSNFGFANFLVQWLGGTIGLGDPSTRSMVLIIDDIGQYGDTDENLVYESLLGLLSESEDVGSGGIPATLTINSAPDLNWASIGVHTSEKLLFADHAFGTGIPAVVVSTANWTEQGFSLNDEVMVILRGSILATKYHFITTFQVPHFGRDFITNDVREIEQLSLMYPFVTNGTDTMVPRDPALSDISTGVIHGTVDNFRREYSYQDSDGNMITQLLDIMWEIEGEYYFGGPINGYINPTFDENEATNPGKNYVLVIPAGKMTVRAVVVDADGNAIEGFVPNEKIVEVSPGGVVNVKFSITAPTITPGTGGTTGGGPGGGGGGGGGGGLS